MTMMRTSLFMGTCDNAGAGAGAAVNDDGKDVHDATRTMPTTVLISL